MPDMAKSEQLQIRVTPEEKARIQSEAARAGMDVSKWVLRQALPPVSARFQALCADLASAADASYVLAEINDFLTGLSGRVLQRAVAEEPATPLPPFEAAYVAAMVECAAAVKRVSPPGWTRSVPPLETPWFATSLTRLRLHLLLASPAPFRRRNLFIDSSVGARV
jgi:hypothetical protein